jgi:hypothetical protein
VQRFIERDNLWKKKKKFFLGKAKAARMERRFYIRVPTNIAVQTNN